MGTHRAGALRRMPRWLRVVLVFVVLGTLACLTVLYTGRDNQKSKLVRRLEGTGTAGDGKLAHLLELNGVEELPAGIDFQSPDTQYRATWYWITERTRVLHCHVMDPESRLGNRTGSISYSFIFNSDGELILSAYDDGGFHNDGFVDLNGDRVPEKLVRAPRYQLPLVAGRHPPLAEKLEVYAFENGTFVCKTRLLHDTSKDGSPLFVDVTGYMETPTIQLIDWTESGRVPISSFTWDATSQKITGPKGGEGAPWLLELSLPLPVQQAP